MKIKMPKKYLKIWQKAKPILEKGKEGDTVHCRQTAELVLNYIGENKKGDPDVLVPVAMMHDIGHAAILPQHIKYVTGPEKFPGGKLVHMLAGAKIADDILKSVKYPPARRKEVVEIISMHDFDQLKDPNFAKAYDTLNKKLFHDLDSLDRFSKKRFESIMKLYRCGPQEAIGLLLKETKFFLPEIEAKAKEMLKNLKL
ncbi:MAG: HD domain-containing protein [Patescibacteria group bacterium]